MNELTRAVRATSPSNITQGQRGAAERDARLKSAAAAIVEQRSDVGRQELDALLGNLQLPRDLTWHIFGTALGRRIEHRPPTENLYLRQLDLSQISLFNVLAEHLPVVTLAGRLANELLAGFLAHRDEVTLLDLGIGTGQQEVSLLHTLAGRAALPKRLCIIGIEPGRSSVVEARRRLSETAQQLGVELDFRELVTVAEHMSEADWAAIGPVQGDLIINAAFAAHHIQSTGAGPEAARDDVFRHLRALNPRAMILAEPNADHINSDFAARFAACWQHFRAMFRFVDELHIEERDRSAIKLFFAREIDDILANAEDTRAERHETTASWLDRLSRTGFLKLAAQPFAVPATLQGVLLHDRGSHIEVAVPGESLISVMCATSVPDGASRWIETREPNDAWSGPREGQRRQNAARIYSKAPKARLHVRDVMSEGVATIAADATLRDAARRAEETGASDLVVLADDGTFAGILSEGDLIRALMPRADATDTDGMLEVFERLLINGRARAPERVDSLMIADPIVLAPDDDLLRVADIMVTHQIRRLPVVEGKRVIGTLSRADLCRALLDDGC